MFANHDHIHIKDFFVKKGLNDFQYRLEILCGENYINCNYAIARIQNIKPLVWDEILNHYVVKE